MYKRIALYTICIAIFFTQNTIFATNIIFDLCGVLFDTNTSKLFRKTKPLSTVFYTISHCKNPRIALFEALDTVEPFGDYPFPACDEQGDPLPPIFSDYLAGIPSKQILERISETIGSSGTLWNLSKGIFDPSIYAECLFLIEQGAELVQECVQQGHHVYILSNLDAETFEILKERNPEVIDLFAGAVISGQCHLIKPDPAIYDYLIKTYKLNKSDCVFIDDQHENVKAAQDAGIYSIQCTKNRRGRPNFKKVRMALNDWLEEREANA